ncbi:TetR/AcrR family transcriptional regulator [Arthrobacter sp. ZGTC212]|uniref:TetR/AcrR family transcriptional regulator n=1 Tax=Arthrobacter sp. ZGTC212 TaxID=2058899 RepID=UPI000CE448F3|nr:TetR/AcrR family transcriptional regulator [Arthrobacter sp. ZGTC212]
MTAQPSARERLLDAADDLAFTQGVAATPVDEILRRANVAPATLYAHFGNKEGLIVSALQRRLARWDKAWQQEIDAAPTPEAKLLAVLPAIRHFRDDASAARWCAFLGVAAESPHPGQPLQDALASDTHLLTTRLRSLSVPVAGPEFADFLASQLVLIFTGVLGMILRGMDTNDAVAMGIRTAGAAVNAVHGQASRHGA